MKHQRIHMPILSYISAFVIGVILFAVFWKTYGCRFQPSGVGWHGWRSDRCDCLLAQE